MTTTKPELEPGCTGAWVDAADGPVLTHWMHTPCPVHARVEQPSELWLVVFEHPGVQVGIAFAVEAKAREFMAKEPWNWAGPVRYVPAKT